MGTKDFVYLTLLALSAIVFYLNGLRAGDTRAEQTGPHKSLPDSQPRESSQLAARPAYPDRLLAILPEKHFFGRN
jgi:hypothetical protein